jgi:hypothetical protein
VHTTRFYYNLTLAVIGTDCIGSHKFNYNNHDHDGLLLLSKKFKFLFESWNIASALSLLTLWVGIPLRWVVLDTTLCGNVCQWLATGRWFSAGTPVSSTNKTDCHNMTEILLKVALNTINPKPENYRKV